MSPRHAPAKHPRDPQPDPRSHASQDRDRHNEEKEHHPMSHPYPHPPHHPQVKPALAPKHDAHSHPHGDELPAHTNPPGPIRPSKKITKTGKS